jgi:hypothetical protein
MKNRNQELNKARLKANGTWRWSVRTRENNRIKVYLQTTGVHTLSLWMREDGFRVDKIVITQSGNYEPSSTGPAERHRGAICGDGDFDPDEQCESGDTCTDGEACDASHACTGGTQTRSYSCTGGNHSLPLDDWNEYVISSVLGADGVDVIDFDHDGDLDVVTPFEESGRLGVFFNPGDSSVTSTWGDANPKGHLNVDKAEDAEFADLDGDGWVDAIVSCTEGANNRVGLDFRTDRSDPRDEDSWESHQIGGSFFTMCDLNQDGDDEIVQGTTNSDRTQAGRWFKRLDATGESWEAYDIMPQGGVPWDPNEDDYSVKGVSCGDIDRDGDIDLAFTASGEGHGVFWLAYRQSDPRCDPVWDRYVVTNNLTMKYDNNRLVDLDGDGDLDIVSTEENGGWFGGGLGVVWYRNPLL